MPLRKTRISLSRSLPNLLSPLSFSSTSSTSSTTSTSPPASSPKVSHEPPPPETEEISTGFGSYTIPSSSVDDAYAALARLYALALPRGTPAALRAHLEEYNSALGQLEEAGVTLCPYERGNILAGSLPSRMSARWAWDTICHEYKAKESCESVQSAGWSAPNVDEEGYARLLAACEAEIAMDE